MNHRSAYTTFGYWCLLLLAGCASPPATPTREARAPAATGTLAPVTSTLTPPAPSDTAVAQRGTSPTPSQKAATPMPAPISAATSTLAATARPTPAQPSGRASAIPIAVAATKLGSVSQMIEHAQISPDNRYVVYQEGRTLYSRPLTGERPRRIAWDLVPSSQFRLRISPDSRWITYHDGQALYRAPIEGGKRVRLTNAHARVANDAVLTQDGRSVVYCNAIDERTTLLRADLEGSPPVQLHGSGSFLCDFKLTPDNRYVIERVSVRNDNRAHTPNWPGIAYTGLYSVPLAGGAVTQLNGSLAATEDITDYRVSRDGSTVVYVAGWKLYRIPTTGGTPIPIGPASDVVDFSPDGQHLIYRNVSTLYSLPMAGGAPIELTNSLGYGANDIQISPDSRFVVFVVDRPAEGGTSASTVIYAAPVIGGTPAKLADAPTYLDFRSFLISPDSRSVISVETQPDGTYSLISILLATGSQTQLGQFVAGGVPGDCTVLPNSRYVLYLQGAKGLFSAPLDGGTARKLSPVVAHIAPYILSQDGSQIVYLVDPAFDNDYTWDVYTMSANAFAP
jgi:Tol biopolymer transport system component